jgi:hypothetical protein
MVGPAAVTIRRRTQAADRGLEVPHEVGYRISRKLPVDHVDILSLLAVLSGSPGVEAELLAATPQT